MSQRLVSIIVLLLLGNTALAQTATIKGFVYEKGSGEPMSFTNVVLEGTKTGVQTDVNGYFSISQLQPGTYTLWTTLLGYDTARATVTVKANQIVTQKLFLGQQDKLLSGVEVSARKTERVTRVNVGVTTVTPREMKLLPSSGGEPDIAQYLQVTPGVIFTGDQGGQLYIRGGAPSQTGILLDGVTIYNPFHSIGLYSVFETDAIRNVEIQSGGFNAQYGNRTSAILDIRTKDGNKNRLSGKLSASPIMARAMLEGPIVKPKEEGGNSTTFLLSFKQSYLESSSKAIYGGLGEPFKSGLPYSFSDAFGKITFSGENGSKLNLFGFNFDDKAKTFDPDTAGLETASFNWKATGGGATFVITPGGSSALISGKFAYSKYNISANERYADPRTSTIDGFEGGIDFTNFLPGYSQVKYGIEVTGLHTAIDYKTGSGQNIMLDRRNTLAGLYLMYRKNFGERFIFEPGIRVQYYSSLSKIAPEPRLGMKYNITDNIRLKAAAGLYSQNIISTRSDRDIVNFFNGFLLSPDQSVKNTEGEELPTNLQTAYHVLGGIEVDIQGIEFNLEPWYKNFTTNIELNRTKSLVNPGDFLAGSGNAYGVDFSAKYSQGRYFFWGVASYQHVVYKTLIAQTVLDKPEVQEYAPPFDRRFNLNIVTSYTAGKKNDWEASLRFNLGSPFPFTQTQGFYENLQATGGIGNPYQQSNGNLAIYYDPQINGGRLSWYHRLDISLKKRFMLSENSNIETTLSVTNVYDRNNIFYLSRINASKRVYQLPVFPSLNVTWNF